MILLIWYNHILVNKYQIIQILYLNNLFSYLLIKVEVIIILIILQINIIVIYLIFYQNY